MLSIIDYIKNPYKILLGILYHCPYLFSDASSVKMQYWIRLGRKLNLKNPVRYTEKLQWLKLYYRKPEFTEMVDKVSAKEYAAKKIGEQYIIPTFGVWQQFDEIDFDKLPNKFMLKTNHSGAGNGIIVCKDKECFDKNKAKSILEPLLKKNSYTITREWPYKDVKPRIMAEMLLEDDVINDIRDYKFYCFNGVPKVMLLASNRFTTHNFDYYDMQFNRLSITSKDGPNSDINHTKPVLFEEMKHIVSKLCAGFPHIRVDLYCVCDKLYFGELTFYDSSGFDNLSDDLIDIEWGSWIELPEITL